MSINLNNLKEQIQTLFQTANTTTASPLDLSSGLTTRVVRVLKVNPNRVPVQASWYPFVTMFIKNKDISSPDFARDQLTAKRVGKIDIKIVGAVINTSISDPEVDQADEDCEDLMENIEQVLRANPTLGGVATWSFPTGVTYHDSQLDEETLIRAGILNLQATVFY